jgi:hypothetical protein
MSLLFPHVGIQREDRKIGNETEPADAEKTKRPRQDLDKLANRIMAGDRTRSRCAEFDIADARDVSTPAGGCSGAVSGRPRWVVPSPAPSVACLP